MTLNQASPQISAPNNSSTFTRGVILSLAAGVFWGCMAVCSQVLFAGTSGITPIDLVTVRLIFSGIFLLGTVGPSALGVMMNWRNARDIALAGCFVFIGQFCFMQALLTMNAGTAAIVLLTVPFWVAFVQAITQKKLPRRIEVVCFVLAMAGVVLIVTHGDFTTLNFSTVGVCWALGSAFGTTGYTIQPRKVLMRVPAVTLLGWAMLIGGFVSMLFSPPWKINVTWSIEAALEVAFVVIVGTVIAFWCYMTAVKCISPVLVGLLVCAEPLTAYLLSVVFLGTHLTATEIIGAALVLAAVILVTTKGKTGEKKTVSSSAGTSG